MGVMRILLTLTFTPWNTHSFFIPQGEKASFLVTTALLYSSCLLE
jgi:hypothetical protein